MTPDEARALLGDVVNLESRLTTARDAIGQAEAKAAKARAAEGAAVEALAAAHAGVDAAQARLDEARAKLADVPVELLNDAATAIGMALTLKARYLEALASRPDGDMLASVTAALEGAGLPATAAHAEPAEAGGTANDSGSN